MSKKLAYDFFVPLGAFEAAVDAYGHIVRHLPLIVMLGLPLTILQFAISSAALGWQAAFNIGPPSVSGGCPCFWAFGAIAVQYVCAVFSTLIFTRMTFDMNFGTRRNYLGYWTDALPRLPIILLASIVIFVLTMLAGLALVIPAFWVMAVYSVTIPVLVHEGGGLRAMRRSQELTREYRWSIVGAYFFAIVPLMVGGIVLMLGFRPDSASPWMSPAEAILPIAARTAISLVGSALGPILCTLIYIRLREIKEGREETVQSA